MRKFLVWMFSSIIKRIVDDWNYDSRKYKLVSFEEIRRNSGDADIYKFLEMEEWKFKRKGTDIKYINKSFPARNKKATQ